MGQERDRAASGTIGIKGGVCRVGSWVIRCPGAASVASRGGAADEDRISRGVEAGRSVPGGVYGRMFGACGFRIVRNRADRPGSAIPAKVSRTPERPSGRSGAASASGTLQRAGHTPAAPGLFRAGLELFSRAARRTARWRSLFSDRQQGRRGGICGAFAAKTSSGIAPRRLPPGWPCAGRAPGTRSRPARARGPRPGGSCPSLEGRTGARWPLPRARHRRSRRAPKIASPGAARAWATRDSAFGACSN